MKKYYDHFQGIRAVGIILIVFSHSFSMIIDNAGAHRVMPLWGRYGVYVFLLLSGILLALHEESYQFNGTLKEGFLYSIQKIKKLYALHFVTYIARAVMLISNNEISFVRFVIYSVFNLTLTQSYIPFSGILDSFNGPSWYLSMNGFLWLITPLFVVWFRKNGHKYKLKNLILLNILGQILWVILSNIGIFVCKIYFPMINPTWFDLWLLYFSPLLCCQIYILSFLATKLFLNADNKKPAINNVFLISSIVVGVEALLYGRSANSPVLGHVPVMLAILYIMLCVSFRRNIFAAFLSSSVMTRIGNLSKFIFLIHGPVIFFAYELPMARNARFVFTITVTTLLSIVWQKIETVRRCAKKT